MPTPIEKCEARSAELRATIKAALEARGALADKVLDEKREMTTEEKSSFDAHGVSFRDAERDLKLNDERLEELRALSANIAKADEVRKEGGAKVTDNVVYARNGATGNSYFRDLYMAERKGDHDARERLVRNSRMQQEARATTVGTPPAVAVPSGNVGAFAPPLWLIEDFVKLARPGRVGVDTFRKQTLPEGISSVNIPQVTGGTQVGLQAMENTGLQNGDLVTSEVSSKIATVGGKSVTSIQSLRQTGIVDEIILDDLARAYAQDIGGRGLNGPGTGQDLRGLLSASGIQTVDATAGGTITTPVGKDILTALGKAKAKIYGVLFAPGDTFLTTPDAWEYITSLSDANGRPLVPPSDVFNAYAMDANLNIAQGAAGSVKSLSVVVDPHMPAGTGVVYRRSDIWLWEDDAQLEIFPEPYADSAGILFRALGFAAMIPDRYPGSVVKITGLPELS